MDIYLDSADEREIERWSHEGIIDGVTTSPSILVKNGIFNLEQGAQRLAAVLEDRPVSVEVTTDTPSQMLAQGRALAACAPNIVLNIPVTNAAGESCLGVVHALSREGFRINTTAIVSFNQAILAAKAGTDYISIFAARIADEGNDPFPLVHSVRTWLDQWGYSANIIVAGIRTVMDVQNAALAGAHIVSIPPQLLPRMLDRDYARDTVAQFNVDAEHAVAPAPEPRVAAAVTAR